jgi:hypothetical protein
VNTASSAKAVDTPPRGEQTGSRRQWLVGAAVIGVTVIVAYIPALRAGYIWDDDYYVTGNKLVQSPDGLSRIWFTTETVQYYPLVFTSFWIEHKLWGFGGSLGD